MSFFILIKTAQPSLVRYVFSKSVCILHKSDHIILLYIEKGNEQFFVEISYITDNGNNAPQGLYIKEERL